jgi:hypothetical protein
MTPRRSLARRFAHQVAQDYDSLRRRTGSNVVAHRPRNITVIAQTDHFEITTSRTIEVRKQST